MAAYNVWFDKEPGRYTSPQTIGWTVSDQVDFFAFSEGEQPASISEYIAYDTLTPPNPFIAVTQDGNGNVVYDGGFPKFYNSFAPALATDSITMEFRAKCVGVGVGQNAYYYNAFSDLACLIADGDKLVYDMWQNSSDARCGIDATTADAPNTPYYSMRDWGTGAGGDIGIYDQNGIASHPAIDLGGRATNKWYHREFDLSRCAGKTFLRWSMAFEGETPGDFSSRFRDVYILDKTGKIKYVLFKDTIKLPNNTSSESGASGYTNLVKQLYDPRPPLTAAFKYLFNAINWTANPAKVAAGIKKILILGDTVGAENYRVKDMADTGSGFGKSLTNLCSLVGFTPTFKDGNDYDATTHILNPTLEELNQYACVFVMSSYSAGGSRISSAAVDALVSFRAAGGGLIIVTDHGGNYATAAEAIAGQANGNQFFNTANSIATRFGAWFSGNFDRTAVNVGFIRANYGEHPLWSGMLDTESIAAGGSESKVIITPFTKYTKTSLPPAIQLPTPQRKVVQVTAKLKSGEAETFRVVFIYGDGSLVKWISFGGAEITEVNLGFGWQVEADIAMDTVGLGTLTGSIYHNTVKVGELSSTDVGGPLVLWYSGSSYNLKMNDGDILKAALESPIQANALLKIKRNNLDLSKGRSHAAINQQMEGWGLTSPRPHLIDAGDTIRSLLPEGAVIPGFGKVIDFVDPARNIRLIREFAAGNFPLQPVGAQVYNNTSFMLSALANLRPPTQLDVFNTWQRFSNAEWYPDKGTIPAGNEALSWSWDSANASPMSTVNSATYIGLVSKEKVENFVLESTMSSSANDDDVIGYVVACRYTDKLETLSLLVNPGGWTTFKGMALVYNYQLPGQKVLAMNEQLTQWPANGGLGHWPGKDIRVGMLRRGANLSFYATDWGDPLGNRKAEFQFDMKSDPVLAGLLGPQWYGYSCISQANTIFKNVRFSGGVLWDVVVDAQANTVYRWNGSAWKIVTGLKAADIFGKQRNLVATATGDTFYIDINGGITRTALGS